MNKLQIIGKYSRKFYQCTKCKNKITRGTNHWGEIYPFCNICQEITIHECLELLPEGYKTPNPWKTVKLGGKK